MTMLDYIGHSPESLIDCVYFRHITIFGVKTELLSNVYVLYLGTSDA